MKNTCLTSTRTARASQRGVSLLEAAMAMVIMGVAATILLHTASGSRVRDNIAQASAHLQRAEAALLAFVAVHRRFPCPAARPNGRESCEGRPATGTLPYLTLGLPEATDVHVLYTIAPAIAKGDSSFTVLMNDQPIERSQGPRAVAVALKTLLNEGYDGMLDVCEALAHVTQDGGAAYTLVTVPEDPMPMPDSRTGSAAKVSSYLGCGAMVSVAGRGQYNAHLAAAIMSQATQDHRLQAEVAYSINYWNLAEGIWSFSNGMYAAMKNWAKLLQTSSALDANIWSNPGPFVLLNAKALTDRAVEMAGVAARLSNMIRYIDNLQIAQENRRVNNDLVRKTLDIHQQATKHALMGSSSAYFLREQTQVLTLPAFPGAASDFGLNEQAQTLNNRAEAWADTLGHGDLLSPHTQLPRAAP